MTFVPDRGDFVWLEFSPHAGHEQAGHRPALVVSPKTYNRKVGLALVCPVTTKVKGYPFEVLVPGGGPIGGAVLADQLKSLDFHARRAKFASRAPREVVDEVLAKAASLLE